MQSNKDNNLLMLSQYGVKNDFIFNHKQMNGRAKTGTNNARNEIQVKNFVTIMESDKTAYAPSLSLSPAVCNGFILFLFSAKTYRAKRTR